MHGADVLSSLFDAVCRNATEGTSTRARLDTTVFASFWTDGDDVLASQKLEGLTPMVASWGHFRVEVGVEKFTLSSTATTSCGDTYRRAQRQLEEFNSSRGSAAYPALDLDWREAVGGVDLDSPEE